MGLSRGTVIQYLLDDQGRDVGEYDGSGKPLRTLVYDQHQVAPIAVLDLGGNPTYVEADQLSSVVAIGTDANLTAT